MPVIVEEISFEEVLASKPKIIFYGARTMWWTHKAEHLYKTSSGLPCDPRGGVLLQTEDVAGFLYAAMDHSEHYGKHGLRAFMAAHHLNCCVSPEDPRPTCMDSWDAYNDALDELIERQDK